MTKDVSTGVMLLLSDCVVKSKNQCLNLIVVLCDGMLNSLSLLFNYLSKHCNMTYFNGYLVNGKEVYKKYWWCECTKVEHVHVWTFKLSSKGIGETVNV